MHQEDEKMQRIRVTISGGREGAVTIQGFTQDEVEVMRTAFGTGDFYVRRNDDTGRLDILNPIKGVPIPVEDDKLLPFWRSDFHFGEPGILKQQEFEKGAMEKIFSPHFMIQSVCGYNYTKENYKRQVRQLESWGFICMRSRRDKGNKFWEIFYLPGSWSAEGDLKKAIEFHKDETSKTRAVVSFLCKHGSFGTLDVAVQRAAMTLDD